MTWDRSSPNTQTLADEVGARFGVAAGRGVHVGQRVAAGQVIAAVGNDGNPGRFNLYFGVYDRGRHTDPMPFLAGRGAALG